MIAGDCLFAEFVSPFGAGMEDHVPSVGPPPPDLLVAAWRRLGQGVQGGRSDNGSHLPVGEMGVPAKKRWKQGEIRGKLAEILV